MDVSGQCNKILYSGIAKLVRVWEDMHVEQVYRTDSFGVIRTGAKWLTMMSMGWALARMRRLRPRSMLDNTPLSGLLSEMIDLQRIDGLIHRELGCVAWA